MPYALALHGSGAAQARTARLLVGAQWGDCACVGRRAESCGLKGSFFSTSALRDLCTSERRCSLSCAASSRRRSVASSRSTRICAARSAALSSSAALRLAACSVELMRKPLISVSGLVDLAAVKACFLSTSALRAWNSRCSRSDRSASTRCAERADSCCAPRSSEKRWKGAAAVAGLAAGSGFHASPTGICRAWKERSATSFSRASLSRCSCICSLTARRSAPWSENGRGEVVGR
mmetsp:Transcript_9625/g.22697  ORF Transcript_9625/g.22697 Transcript_9625/m.22697 type:complete len:235 (-) Transcript_9625:198-902(-)